MPNTPESNYFAQLYAINVNEHLERKGGYSYLSWPYAVSQLRLADPAATWEVKRFNGLPFLASEAGVFVEVAVTVQGVTLSQIHPVLDARNRPIAAPTVFEINTSIQRCLVKAIALHGLGLYIYAGEDLPNAGVEPANDSSTGDVPAKPTKLPALPDVRQPEPASESRVLAATINQSQQAQIARLALELGVALPHVLNYFGVKFLRELPASDFDRVIRSLESRRAA